MKFKIKQKLNDEFTLAKCYVMALGKNRNLSYISKEAAADAEKTLYNIPVIGHIFKDADGKYHLGGHDMVIAYDEETKKPYFKSICLPYGVVPANSEITYEEVTEADGNKATYLVSDVILWTGRFPELYEIMYDNEIVCGESMEINVLEHQKLKEDRNYTEITKYSYSALCMLQKADDDSHVEPCFPESKIITEANFENLLDEFKNGLFSYYETLTKGGKSKMFTDEIRDKILTEFNLNLEDINFEITDKMTAEEFSEKIKEMTTFAGEKFAATYKEKAQAISDALDSERIYDENGNTIYYVNYWCIDFDDTYVYANKYTWNASGKDDTTLVRMNYSYNDADHTATVDKNTAEQMVMKMITLAEEKEIEQKRADYEALAAFKAECEKKEKEAEYDNVLNSKEFAAIANTPEFEELKSKAYSFESVDILKKECFSILGMVMAKNTPAAEPRKTFGVKAPIVHSTPDVGDNEYSEFFAKYKRKEVM